MARGLPTDFALDISLEEPVQLGDFLDEPPLVHSARKPAPPAEVAASIQPIPQFTPSIVPDRREGERRTLPVRPVHQKAVRPKPSRCQVNLTPRAEDMYAEVLEHIKTFSPYDIANGTEVFQGLLGLLHGSLDELDLSNLPRRGAWESVTAKNFPGALGEAFEKAVLLSAEKRRAEG